MKVTPVALLSALFSGYLHQAIANVIPFERLLASDGARCDYGSCVSESKEEFLYAGTLPVEDGCFKIEDGSSNPLPRSSDYVSYSWNGKEQCTVTLTNMIFKDGQELLSFDYSVSGPLDECCIGLTEVKFGNDYWLYGNRYEIGYINDTCLQSVSEY